MQVQGENPQFSRLIRLLNSNSKRGTTERDIWIAWIAWACSREPAGWRTSCNKGRTGAQADVDRVLTIWRECLAASKGPYLFGKEACMADAMYAPVVTRFLTYDVKLDDRSPATFCAFQSKCGREVVRLFCRLRARWIEQKCGLLIFLPSKRQGVSGL